MKYLFSFLAISASISACSIYQSDGRKFLEKQAYEYAGVQAHLHGCHNTGTAAGFHVIHDEPRATVYSPDNQPLYVRVVPASHGGPASFGCDYGFTNAEDLKAKIGPAIEYTLHQMSK